MQQLPRSAKASPGGNVHSKIGQLTRLLPADVVETQVLPPPESWVDRTSNDCRKKGKLLSMPKLDKIKNSKCCSISEPSIFWSESWSKDFHTNCVLWCGLYTLYHVVSRCITLYGCTICLSHLSSTQSSCCESSAALTACTWELYSQTSQTSQTLQKSKVGTLSTGDFASLNYNNQNLRAMCHLSLSLDLKTFVESWTYLKAPCLAFDGRNVPLARKNKQPCQYQPISANIAFILLEVPKRCSDKR